jgi:hypothetical protein
MIRDKSGGFMGNVAFAAIGIEPHDLTALKSTLSMVAGESVTCNLVDQPEQAQVTFVCGLAPAQLSQMAQKLGNSTMLVYCCGRGETPPEGIFTIRRPLRSTDISQLLEELNKRSAGGKA